MFSDVLKRINAHEIYKRHIDIFHAVTYDNIEGIVAAFVRGQPFDVKDRNGNTVLHLATKLNRRLLCRAICVFAPHLDLWNVKNNDGMIPIEITDDANLVVTTSKVSTAPPQLVLFRSYAPRIDPKEFEQLGYFDPNKILLWKAIRCTSAAPVYFPGFNGMADGAIFCNNPCIMAMTEFAKLKKIENYRGRVSF
uniref:PNPLA domain-containing protein n=1 Tax=Caenorhabditis japonica TaxID=281687 RepID=A0A8R1DHU5_CAEJA